jgi:hypothetical protein
MRALSFDTDTGTDEMLGSSPIPGANALGLPTIPCCLSLRSAIVPQLGVAVTFVGGKG